ncbi:hypothetical protein GVAV_001426 [Gurleya vavrai]
MGNNQSIPKDPNCPYNILELSPNATPDEIKRQYHRLLLKYHPDRNKSDTTQKTLEIMSAFEKLKSGTYVPKIETPSLSQYTKTYFSSLTTDQFFKQVNEIYSRISIFESTKRKNIQWPVFGNKNTKMTANSLFYIFYRGYKSEHGFTEEVRKLTKIVQSVDPRLKSSVFEAVVHKSVSQPKIKKEKIKVKKSVDKYVFYCDACEKGFMSEQTMRNHVKGEKHKIKIKQLNVEDIDIEEIIELSNKIKNNVNKDFVEKDDNETIKENDNYKEKKVLNEKDISNEKELLNEKEILNEIELMKKKEHMKKKDIVNNGDDKIINNTDSCFDRFENLNINESTIKTEEIEEKEIFVKKVEKCKIKTKKKIKKKKNKCDIRENIDSLTCSYCKNAFDSRNKLFEHIRNDHTKKD